ncbi:hypothetical protein DENSPDRAFT_844711 [Dentipellis sp. KUC8613]|nr:hypothetical protein DENSPDRAFT_844711 [Dentipellis sp. KUC8613]
MSPREWCKSPEPTIDASSSRPRQSPPRLPPVQPSQEPKCAPDSRATRPSPDTTTATRHGLARPRRCHCAPYHRRRVPERGEGCVPRTALVAAAPVQRARRSAPRYE